MAFNAIIKFTGLCAFVRHTTEPRMRVVMVNARLGGVTSDPKLVHSPVVEFNTDDLEDPGAVPRPLFEVLGEDKGVWFLNQDDITIDSQGGMNPFDFPDGTVGEEPSGVNGKLMAWVPHMEEISRGAGKIKDLCLKAITGPNDPDLPKLLKLVAARIKVAAGSLEVSRHTKKSTGSFVKWDFHERSSATAGRRQVLAEEVTLTLKNLTKLTLRATRFGGSDPRELIFTKNAGKIEVGMKNIEAEQIANPSSTGLPFPRILEDFVFFYELSNDSSALKKIPHRVDTENFLALSRPICPGAVYASDPKV